jgi:ribosomal protein S18 acetylase RimI-like enzyme
MTRNNADFDLGSVSTQNFFTPENGVHSLEAHMPNHGLVGWISWRGSVPTEQLDESDKSATGEIKALFVSPKFRRKGIANLLFNKAKEHASSLGVAAPGHSEFQSEEGKSWAESVGK